MIGRVFVDTGAWIAVIVQTDGMHSQAARTMKELVRSRTLLVTSDYILSETVTRIRYDCGHRLAVRFLTVVDDAIQAATVKVVRVDESAFVEGRTIFERYHDQKFSFVDCTSFALARTLGIQTVFGFDADFSIMGFAVVP